MSLKDNFSPSGGSQTKAHWCKLNVCGMREHFNPLWGIDDTMRQRDRLFLPLTLTGPWFQTARATTCGKTVALQEFPLCPRARSVCGRGDILCTGILSNTKKKKIKRLNKNRKSLSAKQHVEAAPTITVITRMMMWNRDAGIWENSQQWNRIWILVRGACQLH